MAKSALGVGMLPCGHGLVRPTLRINSLRFAQDDTLQGFGLGWRELGSALEGGPFVGASRGGAAGGPRSGWGVGVLGLAWLKPCPSVVSFSRNLFRLRWRWPSGRGNVRILRSHVSKARHGEPGAWEFGRLLPQTIPHPAAKNAARMGNPDDVLVP